MATQQQQPQQSQETFPIKFLPFSSTVDSPFWVQYNHLKLETIRLSEAPIPVRATYAAGEARLQLVETSLLTKTTSTTTSSASLVPNDRIACNGTLVGLNTLESFSKLDKNQFLSTHFDSTKPCGGGFCLLTFCDLKQHKVLYWFGIPALMNQSSPIQAELLLSSLSSNDDDESKEMLSQIPTRFHTFRHEQLRKQLQKKSNDDDDDDTTEGLPAFFVMDKTTGTMKVLNEKNVKSDDAAKDLDNLVFGFVDSSSQPAGVGSPIPPMGWPLRTMLAYLSIHLNLGGRTITVVSYRPSRLRRIVTTTTNTTGVDLKEEDTPLPDSDSSLVLRLKVPDDYKFDTKPKTTTATSPYKVVGWELNARLKPGPRWVNLRPLLDSNHLAIQAADLNLKLMKWRMLPELDVTRLATNTKCLLLGAGTLGCSVARTLLGWGIRDFTILDYGTVSYSNPVRQNLFELEDCHYNGGAGKPKAQAALDALQKIAADVKGKAVKLSIPMPGHAEAKEAVEASVNALDELVREADVIYLLTDTRESRWLPTIMAAAHDKLLINAALGLDSWLVMRHGGGVVVEDNNNNDDTTSKTNTTTNPRLGCYFCNDIVAPENSTKNRTLDQQCTVTRPGLAPIASSMAVELMVSILHHPLRQRAAAPKSSSTFSPTVGRHSDSDNATTSPLGVMPHQIRGSLVSYTMMTPTVPAFACCTACSQPTIEAYKKDKIDLVYQTCQCKDGAYLEGVSGLTAFRAEAAEKMADMDDWDEDEDEEM